MNCRKCGQDHDRCAAHKRSGAPCTQWPMQGQAVCRMHGGEAAQNRRKAAQRQILARAQATFGLPREIAPEAALLEEVHRTAGHVAWLGDQIAAFDTEQMSWGVTSQVAKNATEFPGTDTTHSAVPPVLLQLYQAERKHLVAVCKAAIDAGIAERQVRLAEQQGELMVAVIRGIFADLDLTPEQAARAPEIASRHLRAVAG